MFQSLARLHGNDLSKCLLSELTFWQEKSGICNMNTTYTGCIANAQSDYPPVRKCPSHPWLLGKGFWNPDFVIIIISSSITIVIIYSFILLFFTSTPHSFWELPNSHCSLHKSSISFNNLRAPQRMERVSLNVSLSGCFGHNEWIRPEIPYHI